DEGFLPVDGLFLCRGQRSAAAVLGQELPVRLAELRGVLVVHEREERIAPAARHPRYRMQERAGEHDGASRRRLEAARAELGKVHLPAVEVGIEVDRGGEPAVRRPLGRVIAMRSEVAAVLDTVAAD